MGRFAFNHSDGTQLFDMTGCEIRATLELSHEAFVTALMGQRHLPPPPDAQGNSKNRYTVFFSQRITLCMLHIL